MANYTALAACPKCGVSKVDVHGEIRCLRCEAEYNPPSGLEVKIQDPGEDQISRVLAAAGVAMARPIKKAEGTTEVVKEIKKVEVTDTMTFEEKVTRAVNILKNLPMPKDIKQFKAINKAIASVEKILGVSNGN
jgi:uncharacterized Zn finger protein (UPF0148 family)